MFFVLWTGLKKNLSISILMIAVLMPVPRAVGSQGARPQSQQAGVSSAFGSLYGDSNSLCSAPTRYAPANGRKSGSRDAQYDMAAALKFTLIDAYGRKVNAGDYRGVPVLISTGACWCGGCQGHAEQLRLLEEKYRPQGLQLIRSVTYDNELPAWEFQKHYRLPYVQLLDPSREF